MRAAINTDTNLIADIGGYRVSEGYLRAVAQHMLNEGMSVAEATAIENRTIAIGPRGLDNVQLDNVHQLLSARGLLAEIILAPTLAIPAAPPRVRVRIRREPGTEWTIGCEVNGQAAAIPDAQVIKRFLAREHRACMQGCSRYANKLLWALTHGLAANVLADAIKAALIAGLELPSDVTVEQSAANDELALLRAQPATLLVAGRAYSLVPAGGRDMSRPLRVLRRTVREHAEAEVRELRNSAARDAELTVRQAEQRAGEIRQQLARERERAGRAAQPPSWLLESGYAYRMPSAGYWEVLASIRLHIEYFQLSASSWDSTLYWERAAVAASAHMLDIIVRLATDGSYSMDSVRAASYEAPHITQDRCCMELQGLPQRVTSQGEFEGLLNGLGRGMQVVNMSSLLRSDMSHWHPDIVAQTPPGIKTLLANIRNRDARWPGYPLAGSRADWPAENVSWQQEVANAEEAREVFVTGQTVPAVIRAARARAAAEHAAQIAANEQAPPVFVPAPEVHNG